MSADPGASAPEIAAAVAALRAGEVVAFPTETVYGLGADARNPAALAKVYALKGRPADHPLILHLHSPDELDRWVAEVPPTARRLAAKFWPGPLTLVLKKAADVSTVLTGGQDSIAVRVPSHPVAQQLLAAFGSGIAAPSANRYGRISPTRAAHVREEFPQDVLVLEGGDCEVGLESSIVSLITEPPELLRPGMIARDALEAELGGALVAAASKDSPRVPGSTLQHYAPRTPLALLPQSQFADQLQRRLAAAASAGERVVVFARRTQPPGLAPPLRAAIGEWSVAPDSATDYARELYATLRRLDKSGAASILVESVPDGAAWDAARDRLARAAATFL
jgi:L-threonylcarbamoyladenylate synthase